MINMHLSDDLQKEILKKFKNVEKADVGDGVHNKYHALLKKLEDRWLR